jgi:hypothetical protein
MRRSTVAAHARQNAKLISPWSTVQLCPAPPFFPDEPSQTVTLRRRVCAGRLLAGYALARLRRLLDLLVTKATLADEVNRHGSVPPRITPMLDRSPTGCAMDGC